MIETLINHQAVKAAFVDPDGWRGSLDGRPTFFEKMIFAQNGYRVDLHKFVGADDPECFHSHPATAIRMILSGGYQEELYGAGFSIRRPGHVSLVHPNMTHRISRLLEDESYSLWIRMPKTHDIRLVGDGWAKQTDTLSTQERSK